ncbi:MAG: rod-binding protein [Devosia sp.]|jgi:flagellar protein FlgJ|uniref:rod-binding protein n=1 Tax=Devosia sp. TaxID=1871048 RepID=UPI0019FCC81B|nr:rod-binding protein [Devosia sp.]MBF0679259.1 rod-binding protein [Devosia sp.]
MNITTPIQTTLEPAQLNRLKQQAEDLEGVFLNLLTKEMFATVKSENGFGGGFGEETWRSMQAEQLANTMAQNGGLGIADQVLGDMIAMQEAAQKTQSRATGVYR